MTNNKIKVFLEAIVDLSEGWDENGSTGPKKPFSWETVARASMDYAKAALNEYKNEQN